MPVSGSSSRITRAASKPSVVCVFFFQAEDGIRCGTVTGVQTCALPIYIGNLYREEHWRYFKKICDQHAPLLQAENGTPCPGSGTFKSVCCGTEVIIDQGMTFPDCPNHPRLSTVWKRVKEKGR